MLTREPAPVVAVMPFLNFSGVNAAGMPRTIPRDLEISRFPGFVSDVTYDWLGALRLAIAEHLGELPLDVLPTADLDAALANVRQTQRENDDDDDTEPNGEPTPGATRVLAERAIARGLGANVTIIGAIERLDFSRIREIKAVTVDATVIAEDALTGELLWRTTTGPMLAMLPDTDAYSAFTFFDIELFIPGNRARGFLPWLAESLAVALLVDFAEAQERAGAERDARSWNRRFSD